MADYSKLISRERESQRGGISRGTRDSASRPVLSLSEESILIGELK